MIVVDTCACVARPSSSLLFGTPSSNTLLFDISRKRQNALRSLQAAPGVPSSSSLDAHTFLRFWRVYSKSSSQCQVVSWSAPSIFGVSRCIFAVSSSAWSASDLLVGVLAIAAARRLACSSLLLLQESTVLQVSGGKPATRSHWSGLVCVASAIRAVADSLRLGATTRCCLLALSLFFAT